MQEDSYYGQVSDAAKVKPIRDRLREYYEVQDFVRIKNIDNAPVTYQFTNPQDHETFSDFPGHKDTVLRHNPIRFTLKPGQEKLCPAYEADLAVEAIIKQITLKGISTIEAGSELDRRTSRDWSDPETQENLIKKIIVGVEDILARYNNDVTPVESISPQESVIEDLTSHEAPKRPGRPPKES